MLDLWDEYYNYNIIVWEEFIIFKNFNHLRNILSKLLFYLKYVYLKFIIIYVLLYVYYYYT